MRLFYALGKHKKKTNLTTDRPLKSPSGDPVAQWLEEIGSERLMRRLEEQR